VRGLVEERRERREGKEEGGVHPVYGNQQRPSGVSLPESGGRAYTARCRRWPPYRRTRKGGRKGKRILRCLLTPKFYSINPFFRWHPSRKHTGENAYSQKRGGKGERKGKKGSE